MFYVNYVDLCNKRNISPSAAAEEMGFHRSDVTRWSKGAMPRQATVQKVADYFCVTTAELTKRQKETPSEPQSGGIQEEFVRLFNALSPEQQEREIAYLRELTGGRDN